MKDSSLLKNKIMSFLISNKYAVIVIVVGVVLLGTTANKPKDSPKVIDENTQRYNQAILVTQDLEKKLKDVLEMTEGVGKTEVVISISSGFEWELAVDTTQKDALSQSQGNSQKDFDIQSVYKVVRDNDGKESPVIIKEIFPKIMGVTVACEGGGNPAVKLSVIETVCAMTGLKSNNVSVLKLKK